MFTLVTVLIARGSGFKVVLQHRIFQYVRTRRHLAAAAVGGGTRNRLWRVERMSASTGFASSMLSKQCSRKGPITWH